MIARASLTVTLCLLLLSPASASFAQVAPTAETSAAPAASGPPVWTTSCIYCPKRFDPSGEHYLAVDSTGRTHLAFGGDALYYAIEHDGAWSSTTVDPTPGVGAGAALSLGSDGHPMIAYYDAHNDALKLAQRVDEHWQIDAVDAESGRTSALSLHGDRYYPWIAWIAYISQTSPGDNPRATLNLAVPGGSSGHESLASASPNSPVSLDLSPLDDRFGIAFVNEYNVLVYIHEGPSDLYTYPPIANSFQGEDLSLAIDAYDTPHVMYTQNGNVYYAHYAGSAWTTELVDDVRHLASVSLLLDATGQPHFVAQNPYTSRPNEGLPALDPYSWYGWRAADGWHFDAIEADSTDPGLAWGVDGTPNVAYLRGDGALALARPGPLGGWRSAKVDQADKLDSFVTLAFGPQGQPQAAFKGREVYYGARAAGVWQIQPVLQAGETPQSLVIDSTGRATLALGEYYVPEGGWWGDARHRVWLAQFAGVQWSQSQIESWAGYGPQLAIDGADRVHLTYLHFSEELPRDELRYLPVSPWGQQQGLGQTDGGVSLAADREGAVHISSLLNDRIYYHRFDGSSWHAEFVTPEAETVLLATALAVGPGGELAIAYLEREDASTARVRLVTQTAGGWQLETVAQGASDWGIGLKFDAETLPHLVFGRNGQLQHAWRDAKGWRFQALDPTLAGDTTFSLAVSPSGALAVAYVDVAANDLRLAELAPARPGPLFLPLIVR